MTINWNRVWLPVAAVAVVLASVAIVVVTVRTDRRPADASASAPAGGGATTGQPNIVFVLTDDLTWDLVDYLPQVKKMQAEGITFSDYTVTDSLCCPSRATIFTGQFPHDTKVFTNGPNDGGFKVFHGLGEENCTFATAMQARGYTTGFMGKYLNGYHPGTTVDGDNGYVPPGWDEWDVAGSAYVQFDYNLVENHTIVKYGHRPEDFLVDVMTRKGAEFISRTAAAKKPFMLELATFTPHDPYTPAPRDADAFPGLTAPRTPAFDRQPTGAPAWLAGRAPLTAAQKKKLDTTFRKRAQAVQAVDNMIKTVREELARAGVADNTYLVFSSDNGFHLGQYRLLAGKQTAFDTDINVPLVVVGPGIRPGATSTAAVANIDLTPTFQELAGAPIAADVDGHSMVELLKGGSGDTWRTANLVEHHGEEQAADDPDRQTPQRGNPPTYDALRTHTFTYVEYITGEREYYDRVSDPDELHNLAGTLPASRLAELHSAVDQLRNCHTGAECWAAAHL